MSDLSYSLNLCDKDESRINTYLKVLIVAIPFSIGSGVLIRSCDTSLGAIFVAQIVCVCGEDFMMEKQIMMVLLVDGFDGNFRFLRFTVRFLMMPLPWRLMVGILDRYCDTFMNIPESQSKAITFEYLQHAVGVC